MVTVTMPFDIYSPADKLAVLDRVTAPERHGIAWDAAVLQTVADPGPLDALIVRIAASGMEERRGLLADVTALTYRYNGDRLSHLEAVGVATVLGILHWSVDDYEEALPWLALAAINGSTLAATASSATRHAVPFSGYAAQLVATVTEQECLEHHGDWRA